MLEHARAVSSCHFGEAENTEDAPAETTQGYQKAPRNDDGTLLRNIYDDSYADNTPHPADDQIQSGMETFKRLARRIDHQPDLLREIHHGLYEDGTPEGRDGYSLLSEFVQDSQARSPKPARKRKPKTRYVTSEEALLTTATGHTEGQRATP